MVIPGNYLCNIYSLGPAKALLVQASMEPVYLIRLHGNMQYYRFKQKILEDDHLMLSIWVFNDQNTGNYTKCRHSTQ